MDTILGLLNWIGSVLGWFWGNRFDIQISRLMRELLNDDRYAMRTFDTLMHAAAVFDDHPNELRRVLISVGARRYRGENGEELWGFPNRNKNTESEEPYPFARSGAKLAGFGLTVLLLLFVTPNIVAPNILLGIFGSRNTNAGPILPQVIANNGYSKKFEDLVESGRATAAGTGGRTAHRLVEISAGEGFVFNLQGLEFRETSREGGGSIWFKFRDDLYEYMDVKLSRDGGKTYKKARLPVKIVIELHAETGSGMANFGRSAWLNGHVVGEKLEIRNDG